jgi:hypothetical protein
MSGRTAKWPALSLRSGCAALAGGLAIAYSAIVLLAWNRSGPEAAAAAGIAGAVCGASALLALLVTGLMAGTSKSAAGILGGIILGMGPPLALAAMFGFSGWLVVCFEVALVGQTLAALSVIAGRNATHKSI